MSVLPTPEEQKIHDEIKNQKPAAQATLKVYKNGYAVFSNPITLPISIVLHHMGTIFGRNISRKFEDSKKISNFKIDYAGNFINALGLTAEDMDELCAQYKKFLSEKSKKEE